MLVTSELSWAKRTIGGERILGRAPIMLLLGATP